MCGSCTRILLGLFYNRNCHFLSGNYLIAIALTTTTTEFISPLSLKIYNHTGAKAQAGYCHEITHRRILLANMQTLIYFLLYAFKCVDEELIEGPSRVSLLCPIR